MTALQKERDRMHYLTPITITFTLPFFASPFSPTLPLTLNSNTNKRLQQRHPTHHHHYGGRHVSSFPDTKHSKLLMASAPETKVNDEEDSQIINENDGNAEDEGNNNNNNNNNNRNNKIQSLLKQKEERETMINRLKLQLNEFKSRVEESELKAREAGQQIVTFLEDQGLLEDIKVQFRYVFVSGSFELDIFFICIFVNAKLKDSQIDVVNTSYSY